MKKLPILTLLSMMMAVPLSSVAQDEFSDSAPVLSEPNSQADEDQEGDASEIDLGVLDSQPNVLHGIDGLHQGRVPLNAISPNTLKTFVSVVDLVRREYPDHKNDDELFIMPSTAC